MIGFLLLVSAFAAPLPGQESVRFHSDPNLFIQEINELYGTRRTDDVRLLLSKLESMQAKGQIEENQWIDLADKANRLDRLGANPFPYYTLLIQSFTDIISFWQSPANYRIWSAHLNKLLAGDKKNLNRIEEFMVLTRDFIRQGVLYQSSTIKWKVQPASAVFGQDSSFFISIRETYLAGAGGGDSTLIRSTGGRYYPEYKTWAGEGGRITWERLGIPEEQVQVRLNRYRLNLQQSVYTIDSVNLIDRRYFTDPLIGKVENKILLGVSPDQAGYPRFTSYELKNRIKNIYPGMDYEGGFSLQGKKVMGTGMPYRKSVLNIFNGPLLLFRIASTYFVFQPELARGANSEISIYIDSDSIYHPGILFQYIAARNEVTLIRDGQGLSPSRYFDSYHDIDLDVDQISWKMGDSNLNLSGLFGSVENRAFFESADFFNMRRYNEILLADRKHPLAAVKQAADHMNSRTYTLTDLAKFMKKPDNLVEEMLLRLSFLGFVRYNTDTRIVEVTERTYDFLAKNAGRQDYDVMRFESVRKPPEANATLNLKTGSLKVFAVSEITLSESRNVIIYPKNQTVEILKGRDMLFDGDIAGGLLRFTGKGFRFTYDDFTIHLGKIDLLKLSVYEKASTRTGEPRRADVTSVIENTSGRLIIDKADNKSGLKTEEYPAYPVFYADTSSYVYYDQKDLLGGVYPRDSFYFKIDPLVLRGLNSTTLSDSLTFAGRFETAGIFPPLELDLTYQADHSLGFKTLETPEEGLPVYRGKGQFYNTIAMSRSGLIGSGRLDYLNSTLESDKFLFLPDRVSTLANTFAVRQDTVSSGNPETSGEQMDVTWMPATNKLTAKGKNNPLTIYEDVQFDGEVILEPTGLSGKGTIRFDRYSFTSDDFRFYENTFAATKSEFRIISEGEEPGKPGDPAKTPEYDLAAHQYRVLVNMKTRTAAFEPEMAESGIDFTRNSFSGKPGSFSLDINRGLVRMAEPVLRMARQKSDSLSIRAGGADYLIDQKRIDAERVEYIDVADIRIFPYNQEISIREAARIDTLTNSVLQSRDTAMGHQITGADVRIIDHRNYQAKGFYQYRDVAGREFPVLLPDIQAGIDGYSYGSGKIEERDGFFLSPAFRYYGDVKWNNGQPWLNFDGYTKLTHSCKNITLQWIRFTDYIRPDFVSIPVDSTTNNNEQARLFKGFYLSNQPIELYSTFAGPHLRYSDQAVITADGRLWYDESRQQYAIASPEKIADPEADGPMLLMNSGSCMTEAAGRLNLGVDLGQVSLNGAGQIRHDLVQDSIKANMILTADFFFDPKILDYMARSINNAGTLEPVNYASAEFRQSFRDLVGRQKADELLNQLSLQGRWRKTPEELLNTIVFSDLTLKWNPETGSYQSVGKLGLLGIQGTQVNKKMDGFLEIVHRRGGDTFTFYIETERQGYFFFTYSRNLMQCISGPKFERFNTMIRDTRQSKREQKVDQGEQPFQFYPGQYRLVQEFLRRFEVER